MVALEKVLPAAEQKATGEPGHWHRGQTDEEQLKALMDEHLRRTGSRRARELLDDWAAARARFVKVIPAEYQRALHHMHEKNRLQPRCTKRRKLQKKQLRPRRHRR
jgi:glutamate synthase domain-containing protein 3